MARRPSPFGGGDSPAGADPRCAAPPEMEKKPPPALWGEAEGFQNVFLSEIPCLGGVAGFLDPGIRDLLVVFSESPWIA